jgi:hypothetical protein
MTNEVLPIHSPFTINLEAPTPSVMVCKGVD